MVYYRHTKEGTSWWMIGDRKRRNAVIRVRKESRTIMVNEEPNQFRQGGFCRWPSETAWSKKMNSFREPVKRFEFLIGWIAQSPPAAYMNFWINGSVSRRTKVPSLRKTNKLYFLFSVFVHLRIMTTGIRDEWPGYWKTCNSLFHKELRNHLNWLWQSGWNRI